jgi:hypothetical protein
MCGSTHAVRSHLNFCIALSSQFTTNQMIIHDGGHSPRSNCEYRDRLCRELVERAPIQSSYSGQRFITCWLGSLV